MRFSIFCENIGYDIVDLRATEHVKKSPVFAVACCCHAISLCIWLQMIRFEFEDVVVSTNKQIHSVKEFFLYIIRNSKKRMACIYSTIVYSVN